MRLPKSPSRNIVGSSVSESFRSFLAITPQIQRTSLDVLQIFLFLSDVASFRTQSAF